MESVSGPAQFHFSRANRFAKYIEIHLFDTLEADKKNMTMIINIGDEKVHEAAWINFGNLDLNVLFASSSTTKTGN
jgi:hypothetical protein